MTSVSSTSSFYQQSIYNLTQLSAQTQKLETQISTGNKLTASSDDPLAASQMRQLQRADTLSETDTSNASTAQTNLNQADSTLSEFTTIVTSIQTLATQAASSTLSADDRASIGTQISAYYDQLVSLANTKDASGNSLFGGQGTGDAYTTDSSGNLVYSGTSSASTVSLGSGMTVTTGVTGPDFLDYTSGGQSTNLLTTIKNLGTALQDTTSTDGATTASDSLTALSDGLNAITTAQTVVGARLNWITTTTNLQTSLSTQRATQESSVGGTDLTTAVAQLQETMTVLEASQAAFVKLSGLSLFDAISN